MNSMGISVCVFLALILCTYAQKCNRGNECVGNGRTCDWGYEGCSTGTCSCPPGKALEISSKTCKTVITKINDGCNTNTQMCGVGSCVSGKCACPSGQKATSDKMHCILNNGKMLDETCTNTTDTCYSKMNGAYIPNLYTICSASSKCQCKTGYTKNGQECRMKLIGVTGCAVGSCIGGSTCTGTTTKTCTCPAGTKSAKSKTLCVKDNATENIGQGGVCNETPKTGDKICASSYTCTACPDGVSKCAKYVTGKNRSPSLSAGVVSVLMAVLIAYHL